MRNTHYVEYLEKSLPKSVFVTNYDKNITNIFVPSKDIYKVAYFLNKNSNLQYKVLSDVTAVDWLGRHSDKLTNNNLFSIPLDSSVHGLLNTNGRFCLIYNFLSCRHNHRIILKSFVDEGSIIDSLCGIYKSANWWERETWDMFGLFFKNHPDLRRLLTDYGFEGFPLRKDFPLSGYTEIRYDETEKKIVTDPIEFSQEFRNFDYTTPWVS